jgi:hypothetical protein
MTKSIFDSKKVRRKVGRPKTTGSGEVQIVRMHKPQIAAIDAWMTSKYGDITRPEAIRRLVEIGLSKSASAQKPQVLSTAKQGAARAAELTAKVIEKKIPADALPEERAVRKRKLLQGPSSFRGSRKDRA